MEREDIILTCNKYLKETVNSRFVFGGSYALFMQGIDLKRDFHDIDIKFLDLDVKERRNLKLDFSPAIDKLPNVDIPLEYKEIEFCGEKLLVFTPQTIVDCKKFCVDFIENKAKIKSPTRLAGLEKIKRDLIYLKENYNLE